MRSMCILNNLTQWQDQHLHTNNHQQWLMSWRPGTAIERRGKSFEPSCHAHNVPTTDLP